LASGSRKENPSMNAITARSTKSSRSLPAHALSRRKFALAPWLALALVSVSLLVAGSCTTEELIKLGLLKPDPTDVTPSSVGAGSPDTPIKVTGTNLGNSPMLLFDQTPLVITDATATEIDSTIPASDLATPGTHQLTVIANLPGGPLSSTPLPFVVAMPMQAVVLDLMKSHTGNFTQGGTGTYTITVSNVSSGGTTSGTITVTDILPTGLTLTDLSGTGWNCDTTAADCTRSDALGPGSIYPSITVGVGVATNAPSTVTNEAMVSGGGSSPATAMDPTTINAAGAPAFTIGIMPSSPTLAPGSSGSYTVTVTNSGTAATTGTTSATITLDSNQILGSMGISGTGTSCNNTTLTCISSGSLAPGQSFQFVVPVVILNNGESQVSITIVVASSGMTAMKTVIVGT
jgi:uncharacterized repeat protein (TIGR01451 family)